MVSSATPSCFCRLTVLAVVCLSGFTPVRAFVNEVPCGPYNTVPTSYGVCRQANGAILVGPPPAYRPAVVATPAVSRTTFAYPPANSGPGRTGVPQPAASSRSPWFTIAGITAIAGLITACARLVQAFRWTGGLLLDGFRSTSPVAVSTSFRVPMAGGSHPRRFLHDRGDSKPRHSHAAPGTPPPGLHSGADRAPWTDI